MYIRHDIDNQEVDPQPTTTSVTLYDGNEGWSQIDYLRWNGDYESRDISNQVVVKGTYQKRDIANQSVTADPYQRHDIDNQPILN